MRMNLRTFLTLGDCDEHISQYDAILNIRLIVKIGSRLFSDENKS